MIYNLPEFEKIDNAIEYFNTATREELFELLDNNDEVLQQIALLQLDSVTSNEEAEKIVLTLTEHSSETREYSSFLINRLMKSQENRKFFVGELIFKNFEKAIADVNPKVCRKIIEILPMYAELDKLYPLIIKNSFEFIDGLIEKNKDKNYQYNTLSFRLYWNVFALGYTMSENFFNKYQDKLLHLTDKLFEFREYTLREKAAYLAQKIQCFSTDRKILNIIEKYSDDENFFVKEILN